MHTRTYTQNIHPEHLPYCTVFDIDNGVSLLEECLLDHLLSLGDVFVFLCADLNSRTSTIVPDAIDEDSIYEQSRTRTGNNVCRCSEDVIINAYGGGGN